jgi:ATP-dependent DNA helicase Q4
MNDTQPRDRVGGTTNDGDDDVDGDGGGISGSIYRGKERTRFNSTGKVDGGDLKCFSSATNAGVDPLDDFVDGTYSSTKKKNVKRVDASAPRTRDESVPNCTRHQRPCKLLTVKRNNKGNKGRKFYVCCMPKGEQCDYFKWEEDTLEAAQRALLESSSNSGFIARQVAAAKLRFRELTVPELRVEAKGRGIKATGKKSEILTRLLIWVRDEIADSVESSSPGQETPSSSESKAIADDIVDDDDDSADDSDDDNESTEIAPFTTKMIELSDDDSSTDYSSDVEDTDDCELEICREVSGPTRPISSTIQSANTLHDSLENYFGYTEFRDGQEWAIRRVLAHERTLLVAPTGQGKSLCYALPAAIMDGICLVVSPLISLMQDQLRQLPPKIPAATLSGSMTVAKMALIVDDVMRNRYKVLFVSPERLASAAFRRLVRPKFNVETQKFERQFPVVSLLCVDEVSFFCFLLHLIYHVMLTPRLLENDDIRHIA